MKVLKVIYHGFCKAEEIIVAVFVAAITLLIFISAIARGLNHPINWAPDFAMLLLAWVIFLGADAALRRTDFIRVDMLLRFFPKKLQIFLYYFYYTIVIVFLGVLVRYGISLSIANVRRNFQALQISFSWATMSVSTGAFFMIITIILKLIKHRKEGHSANVEQRNAEGTIPENKGVN